LSVADPAYDDPRNGFRWRANRREWRDFAACRSAPPDLFFSLEDPTDEDSAEPPYLTEEQATYCNRCPVRDDCGAVGRGEDFGVWGGLTAYERSLLGRPTNRKRCPVCANVVLMAEDGSGVCVACANSWPLRARVT
jgi:hypothetical protein